MDIEFNFRSWIMHVTWCFPMVSWSWWCFPHTSLDRHSPSAHTSTEGLLACEKNRTHKSTSYYRPKHGTIIVQAHHNNSLLIICVQVSTSTFCIGLYIAIIAYRDPLIIMTIPQTYPQAVRRAGKQEIY